MDIESTIQRMDAEIAKHSSGGFGIRMGSELYRELFRSDLVSMERFSILGSGVLEQELPAYRNKYGVYMDPDMAKDAFAVGKPDM